MPSVQRCRSKGLTFVILVIFDFAIINVTWSYKETCLKVKNQTVCYLNDGEAETDWHSAWKLCNSRNSTLPYIRNTNEDAVFARFLSEHMPGSVVWTSGRNFTYDNWTWINGRRYSGRGADFLSRLRDRYQPVLDFTLRIQDQENPGYPLHYICQYSRSLCDNFNDTVNVKNGCIRVTDDQRSWYDGRNQCLLTGGDLAVEEDSYMYVKGLRYYAFYIWTGLRKTSWRWNLNKNASDGDEIRYTNWSDDWNPLAGNCISINASNGKWKAIECSEKRKVVCQRDVSLLQDFVNGTTSNVGSCEERLSTYVEQDAESVSYTTFMAVVMVGICVIIISNVIVALAVRKCVHRYEHSNRSSQVASSREKPPADRCYQDLETIRRQDNPDNSYTELKLQPVYDEVCKRGN